MAELRNLNVEFLGTTELINKSERQYPVWAVALGHIQKSVSYIS